MTRPAASSKAAAAESCAALLGELSALLRRFVIMSAPQARVVALWAVHTYVLGAADATPYLAVTSAEKRSGKTRLLEVLELVVAWPWFTGRTTAAVLPRKIDADSPTLLLDESEAAFGPDKEYAEHCAAYCTWVFLVQAVAGSSPVARSHRTAEARTDEFGRPARSNERLPQTERRRLVMAGYVDGFVMPLPKSNVDRYREVAATAGGLWIEHGALEYKECLADDVQVGEVTSFPRSVKLEDDETVIFAWITYESREHRDEVNAKVMSDERMKALMDPAGEIADYKRMIYGGFEVIVDL